jgi:hypothetical protein
VTVKPASPVSLRQTPLIDNRVTAGAKAPAFCWSALPRACSHCGRRPIGCITKPGFSHKPGFCFSSQVELEVYLVVELKNQLCLWTRPTTNNPIQNSYPGREPFPASRGASNWMIWRPGPSAPAFLSPWPSKVW